MKVKTLRRAEQMTWALLHLKMFNKKKKLHFCRFVSGRFPCPPASQAKNNPFPTKTERVSLTLW